MRKRNSKNKNSLSRIKRAMLLAALLSAFIYGNAQTLQGRVYSMEKGKKLPLPGASVYFAGDRKNGTATDGQGIFRIERTGGDGARYLIAGMMGYGTDSVLITPAIDAPEFVLAESDVALTEAVVTGNRPGTVLSRLTAGKTELITRAGLAKMACCNLSESFENSATVTVGFTDAISGAKQVQLLGLPGIYSQLLTENAPTHRGLLSTFGWSYIPGSWLESIQISKGASSVVNGYESISGQINLEMKKPNYTEPLFINLYGDHLGRYEANVTSAVKVAKDLWTGLLVHASAETEAHDYNGDTFSDMPESRFVNLYNRWFYLSDAGIQSRTNLRFLHDGRDAGQHPSHFPDGHPGGHDNLYETRISNTGFSVENKTGFTVGDGDSQSIGIITSYNYSGEQLEYGKKTFTGRQNSLYVNALFTSAASASHKYTAGASFASDTYRTAFEDRLSFSQTPRTAIDRQELIPGIFGEYTYSYGEKFTFIAGVREDWNSHYGWLFTPRANVRYNVAEALVLRASAGRGYRSPNVIADNIGLLASSRRFHLDAVDDLDIERAWNYGGNVSLYLPIWNRQTLTVSLDYFHTRFQSQAVVDTERDPNSVFFYRQQGASYADAWQADISLSPAKGFDVFAAFRYNKTMITYDDGGRQYTVEKPLTSRYRGLVNLSYATALRRWVFDVTAQINGPSRIPGLNGYGSQERFSEPFPVYFAQATRNSKRFDIYIGSENLLDFKQKNHILNADNPFGRDFDSSLVWGPVVGRKIYAGIRLRIGKLP
ncbi:MAG: TonB-dependent receptor [Tannerella sp.]|jgi:hypothetical protein|nr:TonB-dependent receptor [Tannerella sp.]